MWEVAVGDDVWAEEGWHREWNTGQPVVTDEDAYRQYLARHRTDHEAAELIPPPHLLEAHEVAEGTISSAQVAQALDSLESASKLPPAGIDLDRLMSDFSAAVTALRPAGGMADVLKNASGDDHRAFVGRLHGRAAGWGARLIEELDADSAQSELPGSTQVREQRARTLQRRLSDSPALLREALPMAFFGSMLVLGIDHESPGGRRLLDLCTHMSDEDRRAIAAAMDAYEGRRSDGSLPPALAGIIVSWRGLNPDRMQPLTHKMYDALELGRLAAGPQAGTVEETGTPRGPSAAPTGTPSPSRRFPSSQFDFHFDIEVEMLDDIDDIGDASERDRQSPQVTRDAAASWTSARLCAATREAIQRVDERSALPPDDVRGKALCDAFRIPAIVLDLRDPQISDVTSVSVQAAMNAVDGAVPTFDLVRDRATAWGLRLLRALNADEPDGGRSGTSSPGADAADALHSALCDGNLSLERAVPMLHLASMIDTDVDPQSAGGRRVLQLCRALPAENRAHLIGLFNSYDGRNETGQPLHPALVPHLESSWREFKSDQAPDLARAMVEALGFRMLR